MQCAERFGNFQTFGNLKPSQAIALLSLPDAEETEKFIAQKAAEGKQVAEMTIRQLREGQEIGKLVLLAEARLGELFNQLPKSKENQYTKIAISSREEKALDQPDVEKPKPKLVVAAEMGFNKNQVAQFQKLADNPNAVQRAIDYAEKNNTIATRDNVIIWIIKNQFGRRNLSAYGYSS